MSTNRDQIDNISRSSLHNARGIELAERGWLDEAVKEFQKAISNAPDSAQGYDNLGTVYADKGDLLSALGAYTKALSLEPDSSCALHNLGCFLANHGAQLASTCFRRSFKIDRDFYQSRFNLGLCLAGEGKHEQALCHFEKALEQSEGDCEIRFYLAQSLIALGQNVRAIKELNKVVFEQENNDAAWLSIGTCYSAQGFLDEAQKAYTQAIKINSDNIDAVLQLASLLGRQKRKKESDLLLKRAQKLDYKQTMSFIENDEYLCKKS
ncbi:MAG: tetratricopeptide repeat protein [Myxococcales bacterium]|nr:tetratricopeptide repeat protein [Myxococcales bacterium]USN51403.1 MAG: tetratricopeptide repeat protein [Myxococcales bacterium]